MDDKAMEDVTGIVLQYRAVLQNLWNTHCYGNPELRTTEFMHNFEALKHPLFKFFVWDKIYPGWPVAKTIFGPNCKVVPLHVKGHEKDIIHSPLIDMGPPEKTPGKWQEVNGGFDSTDVQLHLLDFFDWRVFYWRDYRYFRVRIDGSLSHRDRVGRDALVDVFDVTIFFDPARATGR